MPIEIFLNIICWLNNGPRLEKSSLLKIKKIGTWFIKFKYEEKYKKKYFLPGTFNTL